MVSVPMRRRNLFRTEESNLAITELWHISLQRVVAGIVKYYSKITGSCWDYRFGHIQRKVRFRPLQLKTIKLDEGVTESAKSWKTAIYEVQTRCNVLCRFASSSQLERMANNIFHAIIAESKMRGW